MFVCVRGNVVRTLRVSSTGGSARVILILDIMCVCVFSLLLSLIFALAFCKSWEKNNVNVVFVV